MPLEHENTLDTKSVIRVAIVEPHPLVVEGLRAILTNESDFVVVGQGESCSDAVDLVERERPDVLVMNLRLPDGDGLEAAKRVHERWPGVHVVMRSDQRSCHELAVVIEVGSLGLISIDRSAEQIVAALRSAARGELLVRRDELGKLVKGLQRSPRTPDQLLSTRELEVLKLLAQARPTSQIAEDLFLSVHTVRNHTRNILNKLGAHSRMGAIAFALQSGILDVGDISCGDSLYDAESELAS
jgi:DNA-binding NarL/FixJ family response regulator